MANSISEPVTNYLRNLEISAISGNEVQVSAETPTLADAYKVEVQTSSGRQGRPDIGTFPATLKVGAGYVTVYIAPVVDGHQYPWQASNRANMGMEPGSPSVVLAYGAAICANDQKINVSWTPNHADNSAVRASQVEVTVGDGAPETVDVSGDATSADIGPYSGTVSVRVRTQGAAGWGQWSRVATVKSQRPPSLGITSPEPGATVNNLPLVVRWTVNEVSGITEQVVSVIDVKEGRVVLAARVEPGAAPQFDSSYSTDVLDNGKTYTVQVMVRAGNTLTSTESVTFSTEWASPAPATADVEVDEAGLSVSLTVHFGTSPAISIEGEADGTEYYTGQPIHPYPDGSPQLVDLPYGTYRAECSYELVSADSGGPAYYGIGIGNSTSYPPSLFISGGEWATGQSEWPSLEPGTVVRTSQVFELERQATKLNAISVYACVDRDTRHGLGTVRFSLDIYPVDVEGDVPSALPATERVDVARLSPDGDAYTLATLQDGQSAVDLLPPLNVGFSYRLTSYSATGEASSVDFPSLIDRQVAAFNFGDGSDMFVAELDPSCDQSTERATELYHFADGGETGGLPVAYSSLDVDRTRSQSFALVDMDEVRALKALADEHAVCWYRDPYGGRYRCSVSWKFSADIPYDLVEASASMTDTVFEEAGVG